MLISWLVLTECDQVWAWLIGQMPFPSLRQAHAQIQQEESRRRVMTCNTFDRSALIASHSPKFGQTPS